MKNFLLLLILACALPQAAFASAPKVPQAVLNAFQQMFPNVKAVEWEEEGNNIFEADFQLYGLDHTMVYAADGKVIQKEFQVQANTLPQAVVAAYTAKVGSGNAIAKAMQIATTDGKTMYEIEYNLAGKSHELLFDANGNLLAEEED